MNRADRRRMKRESKKTVDSEITKCRTLFSKFDNNDFSLIENVIENRVADVLEESSYILDMVYSAKLTDFGFTWEETEKFNNEVSKTFEEDGIKIQKLKMKLGKEFEKEMAKISAAVEKRIRELIESKVNKREAIETLLEENPLLTKSMLTNAYARINADIKKQQGGKELVGDTEVNEAAEKIINIIEEDKGMNGKEEVKNESNADVIVKEATATGTNLNPEVKGLKVLEEKVVKTVIVEGENGRYIAETGLGIKLTKDDLEIYFETKEQLHKWTTEIEKVFNMI